MSATAVLQRSLLAVTVTVALVLAPPAHAESRVERAEPLPLEDIRTLSEVFSRVKADYVDDVSDSELLEAAIRGMLQGLDPHSSYLSPEEFEDLRAGTQGRFGGLGIEVGQEDGFLKVIAPIDDTPAQRAGIEAGDLIIRLDGRPTQGMGLSEAVTIMRGEPGEDIVLTIVRDGEDAPFEVTITRDVIRVQSVRSRMLEPGFGYVRISQFQSRTGPALLDAVDALKEEAGGGLRGMVLDLRNNPGGVLQAAVSVADAFLREGRIVYTEGRVEPAQMSFDANPADVLNGAPLVVLINGGSASASEIVAGALQDHGRAVIMGSRSFGKGSVQSVVPLNSGAAVKLTTARYYTPEGRSIQAHGIAPDIELERVSVQVRERDGPDPVMERDLRRHLDEQPRDEDSARQAAELAASDYPLFEALNLLKGMAILGGRG